MVTREPMPAEVSGEVVAFGSAAETVGGQEVSRVSLRSGCMTRAKKLQHALGPVSRQRPMIRCTGKGRTAVTVGAAVLSRRARPTLGSQSLPWHARPGLYSANTRRWPSARVTALIAFTTAVDSEIPPART